ncbi:MurR/RpiR family transcriptional regulator [Spiroplasma sabaudiense]|nr:hypothetical protein [Spiroplasma sabaudiense]
MESTFGQIDIIRKQERPGLVKSIAVELFNQFVNNHFLSSKKTAAKLFISQATLTKFSKRLSFSGYNELILRLKWEHEQIKERFISSNLTIEEFKNSSINAIEECDKFLPKLEILSNLIKKSGMVHIVYTLQSSSEANLLYDVVGAHKRDVRLYTPQSFFPFHLKNLRENDLIIAFIYGKNVEVVIDDFKKLSLEKSNQLAIFCTNLLKQTINSDDLIIVTDVDYYSKKFINQHFILSYLFSLIDNFLEIKSKS